MHRANIQGLPAHNPEFGAGHIDRYIGTSFDVVYAVYKNLHMLPPVMDFIVSYIPRIEEVEIRNEEILTRYDSIITMYDETVINTATAVDRAAVATAQAAEALAQANLAISAKDDAEAARDVSVAAKDIVEAGFLLLPQSWGLTYAGTYAPLLVLNTSNDYTYVEGHGYVVGIQAKLPLTLFGDWATDAPNLRSAGDELLRLYVDNTLASKATKIVTEAGSGIQGGGDLSANRTLSVDSTVIRTSGDQTLAGVKTFTSSPTVPTPTTAMQAANKKAVDDAIALQVPRTFKIVAGDGLSGGGAFAGDLTLTVKYGSVAGTAVQGNDPRLLAAVPNTLSVLTGAGSGLTGGGALTGDKTLAVVFGTTVGTVAAGNDARFGDMLARIIALEARP